MDRKTAAMCIKKEIDTIKKESSTTVFDEWALVEINSGKWKVIAYQSPRREAFRANFKTDVSSLKTLEPDHTQIGEFALTNKGHGTKFDAYLCTGDHIFALFNNTTKTADEITSDPSWDRVQGHFEKLQHQFILDPVE